MNHLEVLRAELERLFNLDELIQLSRDSLGFDPEQVGGQGTIGSFAGALLAHCQKEEAIDALADALRASGRQLSPTVLQFVQADPSEEAALNVGAELGEFRITRKLGEGRQGNTYLAKSPQGDVRLKVLHQETLRNRRGLQRFLTTTRLTGQLDHPGLPRLVFAGPVEDRFVIAHTYVEGQALSARVGRTGPLHMNEARPLLLGLARIVHALHQRKLVHGALSLNNLLVCRPAGGEVQLLLLDAGTDKLHTRQNRHRKGLSTTGADPKTVSPEQVRGADADEQSDIYSFGALAYELLTGKSPFDGEILEIAFGHLLRTPPTPSTVAPRGWIVPEVDQFLLRLLSKEPAARGSLSEILSTLETLGVPAQAAQVSDEELEELERKLLAEPTSSELAQQLESAAGQGASLERIGQAFRLAASMVDEATQKQEKITLLLRAARLFESKTQSLPAAEAVYGELLELDPKNEVASAGLEDILRRSGKYDELIEMWLSRAEKAPSPRERARAMAEIGRIYLRDLNDSEQATVAFAQAFCDDPSEEHASEVERAAGTLEPLWAEVLTSVGEASQDESVPQEIRTQLLLKAGTWYRVKVSRPDLALPCLQAVLALEPANEEALIGLTEIYRKAQQWQELGMMLNHRANAAATPQQSRNLRTEAAEVLELRLADLAGARGLYESVLAEDPSHEKAVENLARLLEKSGDFAGLIQLLELRLQSQNPHDSIRTQSRIAELYDLRLNNPEEARKRLEKVLELDPENLEALRAQEQVLSKQGNYRELIQNLERQVHLAATPKQKLTLLERIASIYEEEFIDQKSAARFLEQALEQDPTRLSALASLTRHYRVLERWEDASELYEKQLALVEEPSERVQLGLAWGRLLNEQLGFPDQAVRAYELVLEADPEQAQALEALAQLQATTGDADRALDAILTLAEQADSPEARAEQYVRAAKMLEARGNRELAIEHYRNALEQTPEDRGISAALRRVYVDRGDIHQALELLESEMALVEGDRAQARLAGEMALLQHEKLRDDRRAESSAERALRLDPTNLDALLVLGDICFEQKRYVEASAHYGRGFDRIESLGAERAVPILERFVDSLIHSGASEHALPAVETLLRLAPQDAGVLERVSTVTFEHGSPAQAAELTKSYLDRFSAQLSDESRALATYRLGESLRRQEQLDAAIPLLEEAVELDPSLVAPLRSLALAYADKNQAADVVRAKTRHLDLAEGEERAQLLLDIGDLAASKLNDHALATRSYVAALEERPDDRRILTKLMQLYSEDKDWNKLIDVVVKLAEFVDEPTQKVKYLLTAALVSGRHLSDQKLAADYFTQVLTLDPQNAKALTELTQIQLKAGHLVEAEELLKRQVALADESGNTTTKLQLLSQLADLYEKNLVDPSGAAHALEAALELDPDNKEYTDRLGALYASDPVLFHEQGVAFQERLLRQNPFRKEAYKSLRKLYTVSRNADASWAICQALSVLQLADPDEERFYQKLRATTPAPAQDVFSDEDWAQRIAHPTLNPLLTNIFALIEPAVVRARAVPLDQLGLSESHRIEPSQHEAPLAQTLYYAAGVLGLQLPRVYENPNDPGGLSYLFTSTPSLSMGQVGLSADVPPQVAAFVAARQLAYARPGFYLRHFIQTGTALKAWLFAAIKLSSPQFPVAAEIEGSVDEALQALRQYAAADARDHLASAVSKLLQSGTALDLKKWVAAVDLTADRVGFVLSHDLDTTTQVIRASDDSTAAVVSQERFKEVVLYATSQKYLSLRERLGLATTQ